MDLRLGRFGFRGDSSIMWDGMCLFVCFVFSLRLVFLVVLFWSLLRCRNVSFKDSKHARFDASHLVFSMECNEARSLFINLGVKFDVDMHRPSLGELSSFDGVGCACGLCSFRGAMMATCAIASCFLRL